METTEVSINEWTDKDNVVYIDNGLYLAIKEKLPFVTTGMDLEDNNFFKWSKLKKEKDNTVWCHLYMESKKQWIHGYGEQIGGRQKKAGLWVGERNEGGKRYKHPVTR